MCFGKKVCLGRFPARCAEGLNCLHRLFHDPTSVKVKSKVVQQGVWPFVFYGSFALAQMNLHFRNLLAAIHSCASHVPARPSFRAGPFCLSLVPAFAAAVMPSVANAVLGRAFDIAEGSTVCGPATALRAMLDRHGRSLHRTGLCKGPGHIWFHVRLSGPKHITRSVEQAWAEHVRDASLHRSGMQNLGLPCRTLGAKVLRGCRPGSNALLPGTFQGPSCLWRKRLSGVRFVMISARSAVTSPG